MTEQAHEIAEAENRNRIFQRLLDQNNYITASIVSVEMRRYGYDDTRFIGTMLREAKRRRELEKMPVANNVETVWRVIK